MEVGVINVDESSQPHWILAMWCAHGPSPSDVEVVTWEPCVNTTQTGLGLGRYCVQDAANPRPAAWVCREDAATIGLREFVITMFDTGRPRFGAMMVAYTQSLQVPPVLPFLFLFVCGFIQFAFTCIRSRLDLETIKNTE